MLRTAVSAVVWFIAVQSPSVWPQQPITIALNIPLTGPVANVGNLYYRHAQLAAQAINSRGGVLGGRKFEVAAFDNKNSPQEALIALRQITDRRIPFVLQDGGSHIAVPLAAAVARHNERNPDARLLFLNQAGDYELANEKCNFWTFLFYAHSEMVMKVLTDHLMGQANVRRVYLLNQDYAFGHQVRRAARDMIAQKRPDIAIVGDDLHPLAKVKDFAPYVAKIRSADADAVVTGNWGADLALLIKAAGEAALNASFYTYYANSPGTPTAMGRAATGRVKAVYRWHPNLPDDSERLRAEEYGRRFASSYLGLPVVNIFEMLALAMEKAQSADPTSIAFELEGMHYQTSTGEAWMRPDDHQLFEPLFVYEFTSVNGRDVKYDLEGTGIGTRTVARLEGRETIVPTRCSMRRPLR